MRSSPREMKHGVHRTRQLAIVFAVAAASALFPTRGQAQACVAGPFANYINPNGPNSCSIGNVTLSWGQFGGIGGNWRNVSVTPLSGSNANGSYFGFRFYPTTSDPFLSSSLNTLDTDVRVFNPNFDPNDPSTGGLLLPLVQPYETNSVLNWRFTHSLTAPNAITRLELQALGAYARSGSQAPFGPTYLPNGAPDINTGCGWTLEDPTTGRFVSAANACAFFRAQSNNFLWRETADNTIAQAVWGSTGQFRTPDQTTNYCLENGVTVPQLGGDCTSFVDVSGTNFGSLIALGLNQSAGVMRQFAPPSERGIYDPFFPGDLIAQAYLSQAEFRVYYQTNVVPEPGTWALMTVGLVSLGALSRRKRGRT